MKEYSPKRRTALVLTGCGASGAYHAGVLKALDESGVKVDLVVGSGVGTVSAAFAAVAAGQRLYAQDGFWSGTRTRFFFRLRLSIRAFLSLLAAIVSVFLFPAVLALVLGLLSPVLLVVWFMLSRLGRGVSWDLGVSPSALSAGYAAALAIPAFALGLLVVGYGARLILRDKRRMVEAFEAVVDPQPGQERLARALWEVARGPAASANAPSRAELSKRYVSLLSDNLGQPGFRELILRTTDVETGSALLFVLLQDAQNALFASKRPRSPRPRTGTTLDAVDLRGAGCEALAFDAIRTGLLPLLGGPVCRMAFPRGGLYAGEVHRLVDSTLGGGSGISEALAAGAEQVILVSGVPQLASPPSRRRGPRAVYDGVLGTLERQVVVRDCDNAERLNRIVDTVGHSTEDSGRAWQDPLNGRVYRSFALYVIRPERRTLGAWELSGATDPASEVVETVDDLLERGYKDAYRLFIEPVVGEGEPSNQPKEEQEPLLEL